MNLYESINKNLKESDGWIAFYKDKKLEITKNDAHDLWSAKKFAISKLGIPKSKESELDIEPAYNESDKDNDPDNDNDDDKKTIKQITEEKQKHWEESISNAIGGLNGIPTDEDLPAYYQYRPYDRVDEPTKYVLSRSVVRALERKGFRETSKNNWSSMRKDKSGVSYTVTAKFTIDKDSYMPTASATVKVSNVKLEKIK